MGTDTKVTRESFFSPSTHGRRLAVVVVVALQLYFYYCANATEASFFASMGIRKLLRASNGQTSAHLPLAHGQICGIAEHPKTLFSWVFVKHIFEWGTYFLGQVETTLLAKSCGVCDKKQPNCWSWSRSLSSCIQKGTFLRLAMYYFYYNCILHTSDKELHQDMHAFAKMAT